MIYVARKKDRKREKEKPERKSKKAMETGNNSGEAAVVRRSLITEILAENANTCKGAEGNGWAPRAEMQPL